MATKLERVKQMYEQSNRQQMSVSSHRTVYRNLDAGNDDDYAIKQSKQVDSKEVKSSDRKVIYRDFNNVDQQPVMVWQQDETKFFSENKQKTAAQLGLDKKDGSSGGSEE